MYVALLWEVTSLEFYEIFSVRSLQRLGYHPALIACSLMTGSVESLRYRLISACDRRTDGQTDRRTPGHSINRALCIYVLRMRRPVKCNFSTKMTVFLSHQEVQLKNFLLQN